MLGICFGRTSHDIVKVLNFVLNPSDFPDILGSYNLSVDVLNAYNCRWHAYNNIFIDYQPFTSYTRNVSKHNFHRKINKFRNKDTNNALSISGCTQLWHWHISTLYCEQQLYVYHILPYRDSLQQGTHR